VFHLKQGSLSVYSTHLVLSKFAFTAFQQGVERIVGRLLGIFYGLLLVLFLREVPPLYLLLMALGQLASCYVYLSGRLAYAALNAALFIGAVVAIGLTNPGNAVPYAWNVAVQLVLGVGVALLLNAVTGVERTVAIRAGGNPLWPLRADWLSKSAMLTVAQLGALLATVHLGLPVTPTMISAMTLGITPGGPGEVGKKGWLRVLGAVFGGGYAFLALALLVLMPCFPLLMALVFTGMFLAAYGTKVGGSLSYSFLQMGLVMPMVLIGSAEETASISTGLLRLVGIAVGLLIAEFVLLLWPQVAAPPSAEPAAPAVSEGSTASSPGAGGTRSPG
jgi:hypothetical protein